MVVVGRKEGVTDGSQSQQSMITLAHSQARLVIYPDQ